MIIITYYNHYNTYNNDKTYTHYSLFGQVRQELGLADHVWQDKRAAIAKTVDDLGDQFRPAMRAGWLSYIRTTPPLLPARPWGRARWCFQTESIVLLFATNTTLA
jgi:hypothetical protein